MLSVPSKSKDNGTSGEERGGASFNLPYRIRLPAPVLTLQIVALLKKEMGGTSVTIRNFPGRLGRFGNGARLHMRLKRKDSCNDESGAWLITEVILANTSW